MQPTVCVVASDPPVYYACPPGWSNKNYTESLAATCNTGSNTEGTPGDCTQ